MPAPAAAHAAPAPHAPRAPYAAPVLQEYGRLDELTLGANGSLPDYLGGQLINSNCPAQTFTSGGQTFSRTDCHNERLPLGS